MQVRYDLPPSSSYRSWIYGRKQAADRRFPDGCNHCGIGTGSAERHDCHDVFATEDRVVTRWTWEGTLTGTPLLGIAPAGQKLEFDAIDVWTVRGGQLYEHWDQFDWPRAFAQLGVKGMPQPFYVLAAQPADR